MKEASIFSVHCIRFLFLLRVIFKLICVSGSMSTILQMRKTESQRHWVTCLRFHHDEKVSGEIQTSIPCHFLFFPSLLHGQKGLLNKYVLSPFVFCSISLFLVFLLTNKIKTRGAVGHYIGNGLVLVKFTGRRVPDFKITLLI